MPTDAARTAGSAEPTAPLGLGEAAEMFKALANPLRIHLLYALARPTTVSQLVTVTGSTQPLVSQHLRVLRQANLVTVSREGREAFYQVADDHIRHVVEDAILHSLEGR